MGKYLGYSSTKLFLTNKSFFSDVDFDPYSLKTKKNKAKWSPCAYLTQKHEANEVTIYEVVRMSKLQVPTADRIGPDLGPEIEREDCLNYTTAGTITEETGNW